MRDMVLRNNCRGEWKRQIEIEIEYNEKKSKNKVDRRYSPMEKVLWENEKGERRSCGINRSEATSQLSVPITTTVKTIRKWSQ